MLAKRQNGCDAMGLSRRNDPYERIVPWYDIEHDPFQDDAECFVSLIGSHGDGMGRVLEIGAGTGRLAAALALSGHQVTAVEPSPAMCTGMRSRLRQLPDKVARRVQVVEGDGATFQLSDTSAPFDTALLAQNVLAHVLTAPERDQTLARVAQWLRPGGQLLVDIDLAGPRRLRETAGQLWWQGTWQLREGGGELTHMVTASPAREPSIVHLVHFYDRCDPDGALHRTTTRLALAVLEPGEVELALRYAGFQIEETYGDYSCAPFEATSARLILDARYNPPL